MLETVGPLERFVLSRTLWLMLAWPIAGFAWQALVVRSQMARAHGQVAMRRALGSARNAGLSCVALATASTFAHAVVLAREPGGARGLFEPVARGARFGQFDGGLDLSFDLSSATFCALACLVALGVSIFVAIGPPPARGWRPWAWIQLSLAGALLSFLADGFIGTAMGWAMAGAAGAWLAGWNNARAGSIAAVRSTVAIVAMLVGATLLFWGLGGSWDAEDYTPDVQPRFAAVRAGPSAERDGVRDAQSSLTFVGTPGVLVFVDEGRAPWMRSPFVDAPIRGGMHALRLRSQEGSNDDVVARLLFEGGRGVTVSPMGPTFTYRAIENQLVLRDRTGHAPVREALDTRSGPGGSTVVATSLVALLLAAGIMSGAPPAAGGPPALFALAQGATTAALGPQLLARVAFLFPLAQSTWVAVESVGAVILLVAGWQAPATPGLGRWLTFVGVAPAALAFLALGAAGVAAATYVIVFSGAATAALYLGAASGSRPVHGRRQGTASSGGVHESGSTHLSAALGSIGELFLIRAPTGLGELLGGMDRWVVSAVAKAIGALASVSAWALATFDQHVIGAPANAMARRAVRLERGVAPILGVTLAGVVWTLLTALGLVALAHTMWLGR